MGVYSLLIISLGIFSILQFALIPSYEKKLLADRTSTASSKSALLAIFCFFRSVALIATLATAGTALVLLVVTMQGGSTAAELSKAATSAKSWGTFFTGFGGSVIFLIIVSVILGIHSYKAGKKRLDKVLEERYNTQLAKLKREYESGNWPELSPDESMMMIQRKIDERAAAITSLQTNVGMDQGTLEYMRNMYGYELQALQETLFALDIGRRIDMTIPEGSIETQTKGMEKFFAIILGTGLVKSLGGFGRCCYTACMFFLVFTFIGINSKQATKDLLTHAANLDEQRIEISQKEVENQWQAAKAQLGDGNYQLTSKDKAAIGKVVNHFEHQMHISDVWQTGSAKSSQQQSYQLRSNLVRQKILQMAAGKNNTNLKVYESDSQTQNLNSVEKHIISSAEKANTSAAAKFVQAELESAAQRSPEFMQQLRKNVQNLSPVRQKISSIVLTQVTEKDNKETNGLTKSKGLKDNSEAIQNLQQAQAKRFLTHYTKEKNLKNAFTTAFTNDPNQPLMTEKKYKTIKTSVNTATKEVQASITTAVDKLQQNPPSVFVQKESHVHLKNASGLVQKMGANPLLVTAARRNQLADCLATYNDYFAPQMGAEKKSVRGKLLASWQLPKLKSAKTQKEKEQLMARNERYSKLNFRRSRSFLRLQAFSRIGGVLIGRELNENEKKGLEFRDILWEDQGKTIRFTLIDKNGEKYQTIPYRKSILYHSLLYAVDGRPTAVTMVTATPLTELKILLHPTMVDTAMGYRLVEIDRFVDQFTGREKFRTEAQQQVRDFHALYRYAWAARLLGAIEGCPDVLTKYAKLNATLFTNYKSAAWKIMFDPKVIKPAQAALNNFLRDHHNSPLKQENTFYDSYLVKWMTEYSRAKDLKEFGSKIQNRMKTMGGKYASYQNKIKLYNSKIRTNPYGYGGTSAYDFGTSNDLESILNNYKKKKKKQYNPDKHKSPDQLRREVENMKPQIETLFTVAIRSVEIPPTFEVWSGVRELSFGAIPENFLLLEGKPRPKIVDFMLQIAFTSEPRFGEEFLFNFSTSFLSGLAKGLVGSSIRSEFNSNRHPLSQNVTVEELQPNQQWVINDRQKRKKYFVFRGQQNASVYESVKYSDYQEPWEFPKIKQLISDKVYKSMTDREKSILYDVEEFTIGQRFFRLVLGGHLGASFPVEKLVKLQAALMTSAPKKVRTLRWNARPGQYETILFGRISRDIKDLDKLGNKEKWFSDGKKYITAGSKVLAQNAHLKTRRNDLLKLLNKKGEKVPEEKIENKWQELATWRKDWNQWLTANESQMNAIMTKLKANKDSFTPGKAAYIVYQSLFDINYYGKILQIRSQLGVHIEDEQMAKSKGQQLPPLD